MAHITLPDQGLCIDDAREIACFLRRFRIWYERWDVAGRIADHAGPEEILAAFAPEIDEMKRRGGYVTADVIDVTPQTPGLDAMLEKFKKEHTHSEDEVRFVVKGRGIFFIHPEDGPVFSVETNKGDMISVPAGTRHWFDLCAEKRIAAIRLFKDTSGWAPLYVEDGVDNRYTPVCFGPAAVGVDKRVKPPVKP